MQRLNHSIFKKLSASRFKTHKRADHRIGAVTCPKCSHNFIKLTDEADLVEKRTAFFDIVFQVMTNIGIAYLLYKINIYLLPDDALTNPITLLQSIPLFLPSLILMVTLGVLQYMGASELWKNLAYIILAISTIAGIVILFLEFAKGFIS